MAPPVAETATRPPHRVAVDLCGDNLLLNARKQLLPFAQGTARVVAKAVIVEAVERLHWRLWNGKVRGAKISVDRVRAVMHPFRGEPSCDL
jgi:hypothetical protein